MIIKLTSSLRGPRSLVDGVWLAAGGGSARAGEGVGLADDVLDVLLDQVDGHHVLGAARNDHVRVLLGRDAELLEGGLDKGGVLVQHALPAGARLCPALFLVGPPPSALVWHAAQK